MSADSFNHHHYLHRTDRFSNLSDFGNVVALVVVSITHHLIIKVHRDIVNPTAIRNIGHTLLVTDDGRIFRSAVFVTLALEVVRWTGFVSRSGALEAQGKVLTLLLPVNASNHLQAREMPVSAYSETYSRLVFPGDVGLRIWSYQIATVATFIAPCSSLARGRWFVPL